MYLLGIGSYSKLRPALGQISYFALSKIKFLWDLGRIFSNKINVSFQRKKNAHFVYSELEISPPFNVKINAYN